MSGVRLELLGLQYGGVLCLVGAIVLLAFTVGLRPPRLPKRIYERYVADLDRRLRLLFIDARGSHLALRQLAAGCLLVTAAVAYGRLGLLIWLLGIAVLPRFVLERRQQKRRQQIEEKLDGFVLALANALRANPSIGGALASVL